MPSPRFFAVTPSAFPCPWPQRSEIHPLSARESSVQDEQNYNFGIIACWGPAVWDPPTFCTDATGSQDPAAPSPGPTPFDRAEMPKKSFFIAFKAGMLLKTDETRTKVTNFEGFFDENVRVLQQPKRIAWVLQYSRRIRRFVWTTGVQN